MALIHALLIVVAVVVLLVTPCVMLLCLMFGGVARLFGHIFGGVGRPLNRLWRAALRGPVGRHWGLVRVARFLRLPTGPAPESLPPPIAQVAADLRRLRRLRRGVATRSAVWFVAVQEAYDDRLRTACAQLGIAQYLEHLDGVDRELERMRVEGELRAAGLVTDDVRTTERPGPR